VNTVRLLALWLAVAFAYGNSNIAHAAKREKRNKDRNFVECPWQGLPTIENFAGNVIIVANTKFKFGKLKHLIAFQSLLSVCNASAVVPSFTAWRQAHQLVVVKVATSTAYAISAAARAMNAETDAERRAIAIDAAAKAARFAAELIPLTADAKAKKQMFLAEFMATSSL
jgi:hypothetical protein